MVNLKTAQERKMTNGKPTIKFYGGTEKRIRHRLGLGSAETTSVEDVLRIAKIHNYNIQSIQRRHWVLKVDNFHRIFTGASKIGTCTFDYDVGIDSTEAVIGIYESRSFDPDYGIGRIFGYLFNFNNARVKRQADLAEQCYQSISFPNNKEKIIRKLLGLAETQKFDKDSLIQLGQYHGYDVHRCKEGCEKHLNLYPNSVNQVKGKRYFQMTIGHNDNVESIKEVRTV